MSVARSRTFREHQGKILLEGRRLICDALAAGANPQMVFFSTVDRLLELPVDKLKRATLVKVRFEDIEIWSELVAPQGVIGEGHTFGFPLYDAQISVLTDSDCLFCSHIFPSGPVTFGLCKSQPLCTSLPDMRQHSGPRKPWHRAPMCCCCRLSECPAYQGYAPVISQKCFEQLDSIL